MSTLQQRMNRSRALPKLVLDKVTKRMYEFDGWNYVCLETGMEKQPSKMINDKGEFQDRFVPCKQHNKAGFGTMHVFVGLILAGLFFLQVMVFGQVVVGMFTGGN